MVTNVFSQLKYLIILKFLLSIRLFKYVYVFTITVLNLAPASSQSLIMIFWISKRCIFMSSKTQWLAHCRDTCDVWMSTIMFITSHNIIPYIVSWLRKSPLMLFFVLHLKQWWKHWNFKYKAYTKICISPSVFFST